MHLGRPIFIIFISILFHSSALFAAKSYEVLEVSSSGKSIILDKGRFEGIALGQYVKFVVSEGTKELPKLRFVADGESVKVNDVVSYWLLRRVALDKKIFKGAKLLMIPIEKITEKRSKFDVLNKKVILSESMSKDSYLDAKEKGVPRHIRFKENKNYRGQKQLNEKSLPETHIEVTEYDTWKKSSDKEYVDKYMAEFETRRLENEKDHYSKQKAQAHEKRKVFKSVVDGVVKKVNALPDGLKGLYREQKKDEEVGEFKENIEIKNVYEQYHENKKKTAIHPSVYEKIKKEGPMWSGTMSDEELRRYIVKSGIEKEELRQKDALTTKTGHELQFIYSSSLTDHTTPDDSSFRGKGLGLTLGYEYHLMRATETLRKWSLEVQGVKGRDYYSLGSVNGKFTHSTFKMGVNWYFIEHPAVINAYMWYFGLGFSRGVAKAESNTLSKEYEFQTIGLPSVHIGTKYRFLTGDSYSDRVKVGMGLNLRLSSEPITLTSSDVVTDDIESSFSFIDYKFQVGLSVYF